MSEETIDRLQVLQGLPKPVWATLRTILRANAESWRDLEEDDLDIPVSVSVWQLAQLAVAVRNDLLEQVAAHLLEVRQSVSEARDATHQLIEKSVVGELLVTWQAIGELNKRVANLEAKKE